MKYLALSLMAVLGSTAALASEHLSCDTSRPSSDLNCALVNPVLIDGTQNFHSTFKVGYSMTCNPTPFKTFIVLKGGDGDGVGVNMGSTDTLTVEGYGPLKFVDNDPTKLAKKILNKGCSLQVTSITRVISVAGLAELTALVNGKIAESAGVIDNLADLRGVVTWYDLMIKGAIAPAVLDTVIAGLEARPDAPSKRQASLLKSIQTEGAALDIPGRIATLEKKLTDIQTELNGFKATAAQEGAGTIAGIEEAIARIDAQI